MRAQVRAVKQITVEEAPNVLVVHLKRFEFGLHGHKLSKRVEYDPVLDLGPFMSAAPNSKRPPGSEVRVGRGWVFRFCRFP